MFGGVFVPTMLTILGVIYLRVGWTVGNAGLGGGLFIIMLATLITLFTTLSISSIATNIRVGAGGAFSIISQSLGVEMGGSIVTPLYVALSISIAFYVFAFTEGWMKIFPEHPEVVVVLACFTLMFAVAYVSANFATRIQYLIGAVVLVSLFSVFLGTFAIADTPGLTETPVLIGDFPSGDFWHIFAVFFPSVTGILVGVNMSGALKDPRRDIPRGTLLAVLVGLVLYVGLAIWLSFKATPDELVENLIIVVDKALYGPAILAGILAATFSSGLAALVGAPRVMQALAERDVIPGGGFLKYENAKGEPRPALWMTGAIGLAATFFGLLTGGLNAIAPLMTMFFLITYSVLNGVILIERALGLVSFRPTFAVHWIIPLLGFVGTICVMFLINALFSLVSLIVVFALYAYLSRRQLTAPWSDVRSGLFVTFAEWAAKRVGKSLSGQERAWKPNLLVPVISNDDLLGSYRFLRAITYPRGSVHVVGIHRTDEADKISEIPSTIEAFNQDKIFARSASLCMENYKEGLVSSIDLLSGVFFRPNALFMTVHPDHDQTDLQYIYDRAKANEMGVILYTEHPITSTGREQTINIWVREQSPSWEIRLHLSNLDLALLLAYQISRNWNGHINLITVVQDEKEKANGEKFFRDMITWGRMPRGTQGIVYVGTFDEALSRAPKADLSVFGLHNNIDIAFMFRVMHEARSSCIFVRDSGYESALA
ncbi:MAG: Na-K-Cl cotransporter [Anaerolineaceae bacterium]|nr:MAG: Na-K-Cl cotransporter [Anaerolineaceae bacterium]